MKNPHGSVSTALMGLMIEFKRRRGVFEPRSAATFLALLGECLEELERLEIQCHPCPIRLAANDNDAAPDLFDGGHA